MFGSTKHVASPEPKLFGVPKDRVSTNESARPLPWFAGRRWMGVTWVGDAFDVVTTPVTVKVGKGKSSTVGYNYSASFAALVCGGQVDKIYGIRFDDELVWRGELARADSTFVTIAIENRGTLRLYWGGETQTIDSLLNGSGLNHSGYRGQCYIVGEEILFGQDRTNAPNIQLELQRIPAPSWLTANLREVSGDANPMGVLSDWWTDARYGLGRSAADLDTVRLLAAATTLAAEGVGISPLLTTDTDFKGNLVRLLEHVDGYPTSYNGKFGVELIRVTSAAIPALDKSDLLTDPSIASETWTETHDETRVKFADRDLENGDNSAVYHDRANYVITSRHRAQNLDRPWVTRKSVAAKLAGSLGRVAGIPQTRGRLQARASSVSNILVGSPFTLTTRDGEVLSLRCTERAEPEPGKGSVELAFVSDTAWANQDDPQVAFDTIPEETEWSPTQPLLSLIDCPYAFAVLATGTMHGNPIQTQAQLLFMIGREDGYTTAYDMWKSRTTNSTGTYTISTNQGNNTLFRYFALKATLNAEYSENTLPIDELTGITLTVVNADQDVLDDEWDLNNALDHQLLAFVGTAATEIMSLYNVVRTSATTFTAKCVRGLYDTRRRTHANGTVLWIQTRVHLEPYAWPPLSEQVRYYKCQPYFGSTSTDYADLPAGTAHTENKRTLLPIAPGNLHVNGDGNNSIWTTGVDCTIEWCNTSRERTVFGTPLEEHIPTDLTDVFVEVRSYDGVTLHWSYTAPVTSSSDLYDGFTLANSTLVTNVNADFQLRAYGQRNGLRSLDYSVNLVRKV